MASSQDEEEWDKSTSEIQSEDSEDLHDKRPNRWRGPPQSWRSITEEDRLTFNALERVRNQDLSLHLYNAFALRQASLQPGAPAAAAEGEQDADAWTGQVGGKQAWDPPKGWTAWPLRVQLVPPDDFMRRTEDEDEVFTLRRVDRELPSSRLEEAVSASVLRLAKEKFRKRNLGQTPAKGRGRNVNQEPVSSGNESTLSQDESDDDDDDDDDDDHGDQDEEGHNAKNDVATTQNSPRKAPQRTFKPDIATDDDLSYGLIRPSARKILEKVDKTLVILHNSRMTSAQALMEPDESSSDSEEIYNEATPSRRSRSRATSGASTDRARTRSTSRGMDFTTPEKKKSNRGRKPTYTPREGESEREFLIRRAREQKKKRPVFLDDEEGGTTTAAEDAKSPRKQMRRTARRRESMTENTEYWIRKRLERLGLRDWSDIMGAAALAGFSPKVIERATQRCANLFGQGMDVHTITETAASSGSTGIETKRYLPGKAVLSSSSESEAEDGRIDLGQARSMSRQSSVVSSRAVISRASSDIEAHRTESPRKRQKRSESRGSAVGQHYCPHMECDRALRGFDRPFNLKRHIKLKHAGQSPGAAEMKEAEADDGMDGGVHRDGFLQPIRVQRGWRAEDVTKRAERTPKKRGRHESRSSGESIRPDEASSTDAGSSSDD